MANILLVEPFYTGSHKAWADQLKTRSQHEITLLTLKGKFWKWRMHGAAISLSAQIDGQYDLIIVTDMIDLSLFKSLLPNNLRETPILLYFHENQLAYPASERTKEWDRRYAWLNYTSALVADFVCFNSEYNLSSFIGALHGFLKALPDHRNLETIQQIEQKSQVLHLGLELEKQETKKSNAFNEIPICLWNHRWEHDKNPELFFQSFIKLKKENIPFKLIVAGQSYVDTPQIFKEIQIELKEELIHFGYVKNNEEYKSLIRSADILPVTSKHDFFGISVLEAIYAGCVPLLPHDLAYVEHFPEADIFYHSETEFYNRLKKMLTSPLSNHNYASQVKKYDWNSMILHYDDLFSSICT